MGTKLLHKIGLPITIAADLMKSSIHFFYLKFIAPRSHSEDRRRQEYILNIILAGSIFLLFCLDCTILYNELKSGMAYGGVGLWKFSLILLFFITLYILSRIGYVRLASYSLISLYFITVSYASYRWGVSLPSVLLIYSLIIIISSILVSSRFGIIVAGLVFLSLLTIGTMEIESGIVPHWKEQVVGIDDIVVYSVILFVISLISWLSTRQIEYSLKRARKSEADLMVERDSLEVKVQERTKDLQQAQIERMAQLSRFAEFGRLSSGLFHDLVSPLSSVAANLSAIKNSVHPEIEVIKDQLSRAVKASQRMNTFISSVKKQIRVDEFKEIFQVNTIIREVINIFHYKALKGHIFIDFTPDENVSMYGNPIKLHQVICNLVSNAIDAYENFTPPSKKKTIKIILRKHRHRICISVIDHGSGISPQIISRIFDQFFTTKSTQVSMGLGLTTTKEIIEKEFNGTIAVSSDPSHGTKFTITIPYDNASKDPNKVSGIPPISGPQTPNGGEDSQIHTITT